ncbi:DNA-primase RepB domain-containing protein [Escherichia coli]|uniref:DNA-primase RepB domain-containing protein n=1 Tax=Escherichia coli TaxID=562 RepID=UPI0032D98029
MALAGAASNRATGGHMADFQAQVKGDRPAQAIARQLKAMGCDRYDIGIRDAASGKMMNREWTPQEVQQNADWLKRMNAQGNDIYIRPAEQARHGLVLVDDLSSDDLDAMKQEGREPAAIIETSPKNYQAWVKVAQDAPAVHRGVIARELAREYDADPASADSRHYGRLAGFTNRKDKHTSNGYQPWVLCRESSGQIATAGPELMQQAGQVLDSIKRRQEKARRLEGIEAGPKRSYRRDAVDDYRSEMAGLIKRYGDDLSRCDFIAAMKLASNGREPDEIAKAMAEASPAIMDRKAGHEADYIQRTLQKVMELPQVQEARAELARQAQRKGPEPGM